MSRSKANRKRFKYDVALSFAGEDRKKAKSLSRRLSHYGLSVFYDEDREASLWGKRPDEFEKIYGPESRYVIPLISRHYVRKDWTKWEFETAKREEKKRRDEFILPVRLDDSRLFGLHDEVIHQDARKTGINEIARLFAQKVSVLARSRSRSSVKPINNTALSLIRSDVREPLGLIGTAAIPLPLGYFERLFPQYPWASLIRRFSHLGIIEPDKTCLRINKPVLTALGQVEEEQKALNEVWIRKLFPLKDHIDAAAFLSIHFLIARRFDDSARVVVDVAQHPNLGWWNVNYLTILNVLTRRRVFSKLNSALQIEVLNGFGICLSQAGEYKRAIDIFYKLRRLSNAHKNSWGIELLPKIRTTV